jgi:GNAT superfamily N-acetyltransferase
VTGLRPLSALATEEREWIAGFLGGDGILPLYFDTAVEDLARGIDNRLVLIGRERKGLILGITFAGLEAFTIAGSLDEAELRTTYTRPMAAELHVTAELASDLRLRLRDRLAGERAMRVETCALAARAPDPHCRILTQDDADRLSAFYDRYNPRHVFSPWMLEHPFIAVVEQGEIVAGAGVLASSKRLGWALIGNFLTRPDRRGHGLARRVGRTLLATLGRNGIGHAALVTTDDNAAARSVYGELGFSLAEARIELDLK